MMDDHIRDQQNLGKAEPCVIELLHESGLSNSTMQLYRGNDPVDKDVDIGGNEPPVSSYTPVGQEKGANKKSDTGMILRTSSDTNSRNASENVQNDDVKASSPLKVSQNDLEDKAGTSDVIDNQSGSGLDQVEHMSQQKPSSVESDSQKDDGDSAPNSMPVSPGKLYRAALLKIDSQIQSLRLEKRRLTRGILRSCAVRRRNLKIRKGKKKLGYKQQQRPQKMLEGEQKLKLHWK